MPSPNGENWTYEVHNSAALAKAFRRLQARAKREGRGEELLRAAHEVFDNLRRHPNDYGEALYRLPALRMQIRCVSVRPLYVDFGVCEDRPLVIIKDVKLLSLR
jgi:hypothetical protein